MANGVSFEMLTKPFTEFRIEQARVTDKTTMYALRAAGRKIGATARATPIPVVTGNLKKSVKNSKRLNHVGTGDYSMFVGQFGTAKKGTAVHYRKGTSGALKGVPLYRGKIEATVGYMKHGVTGTDLRTIYETALAKAYQRFK